MIDTTLRQQWSPSPPECLNRVVLPVAAPGITGLQPGSGSHARAWRSQDTPHMSLVKVFVGLISTLQSAGGIIECETLRVL